MSGSRWYLAEHAGRKMRFLYLTLCVLSVAGTIRFASQLTRSMASHKDPNIVALAGLSPESSGSKGAELKFPSGPIHPVVVNDKPNSAAVSVPMHPPIEDSTEDATEDNAGETGRGSVTDQSSETEPREPKNSLKRSEPVRHQSALHDSMITPGNFEYLGAIRPPHIQQNETTFAYGGWALAYRADGDSKGPDDGFPGSLYMVGHRNHQKVVEINIPAPVHSKLKLADDLPVAEILQPFEDVTDGLLEEMTNGSTEPFNLGGLLVTNGLLHWTMHKYYNVENRDYPSHGTSGLEMESSIAEGLWHLGPLNSGSPEWNSYKHAGYIFEIPPAEATRWFGGRNLISGLQISTGLQASSQGPAMFAYSLPPEGTAPNASLSTIPLVWYSEQQPLKSHHPADRWTGGAWLTLGDKQAIVIAGRKALGDYYYGEARPEDCTQDKGYHGPPYEVELLFYSPASLIHAANGRLSASGLTPWYRWDSTNEGGGLNQYMFNTCGKHVGGMSYDRERNLLYLVQIDAGKTSDNDYEALPIVHVFRITE